MWRRSSVLLIVALTALSANSCASVPENDESSRSVMVAPGISLELPGRPEIGRRIEAAQSVRIRRRDKIFAFQTRLSIADGRFHMAALDLMGRRALTLDWTERGIEIEAASWLPEKFMPRNLLADMVMIYWPADDVRAALRRGEARFEADAGHRSLLAQGSEIIRIEFHPPGDSPWTGTTTYENAALGYSLEVRSTEIER
jgi:hypothetical protein